MMAPHQEVAHSWTAEEICRIGYRVVDLIAQHLTGLPERPVFRPVPPAHAAALVDAAVPDAGRSPDAILDEFARLIEPYPFGNGHPRFYGWVNSPPTVIGVFAEALAAAMNPSVAGGNHAAVYLEHRVLDWMKSLIGFPRDSMGLLVSGGSMAALTGLAVARHVATRRLGWDVRSRGMQGNPAPLVIYKSIEGHGCNQKAAELLGVGSEHLRAIDVDVGLRMRADALDDAIRADLARRRLPMAVVATAGTVNTGAIDPLDEIADVCAAHGVWLHVDGAYGAPAVLSTKYRDRLLGLARADSVAMDAHKWLYVPVEAGAVFVKDAHAMREAFSLVPPYLRTDGDAQGVQGPPWFSEFGVQQTRGFRALKVWMALEYHGLAGYRQLIEHDINLAEMLAHLVRQSPDLECREPQGLSVVCFRFAPGHLRGEAATLNELNEALLTELQLGGRAFLSGTTIDGCFWLRACIVNHRARPEDVAELVTLVREIGVRRAALE